MSVAPPLDLEATPLFDRVHATLLAGAIGDAMGGAIEGLDYREIAARWGRVETFLPFQREPSYHGAFSTTPGTYTDDTRLRLLLCQAIIEAGDLPARGELASTIVSAYHNASHDLERGFLEEYALKAIHGGKKLIFGGEPTNGAIMMNAPIGLVCAGDPREAFDAAYDLAFLTDGYAKHSAAVMAATYAAALRPGATVMSVIDTALDALTTHRERLEGPHWRAWPRRYLPNERAVETAVATARRHRDVFKLPPELYDVIQRGPLFSEASQTLAVALAMFVAAEGDVRLTILGCVNYGRDNDSYATVAGGLAGALGGFKAIPPEWIPPVVAANPSPDLKAVAVGLSGVILRRHARRHEAVKTVEALLR
jgi:ADP-ribosylglycohydrolase